MNRIQKNFSWMPFDGELRTTKCAKSGKEIQTSWPEIYDERILCEEAYLKVIH
jgi:recombinational DNA repair protein (RecF pathway)